MQSSTLSADSIRPLPSDRPAPRTDQSDQGNSDQFQSALSDAVSQRDSDRPSNPPSSDDGAKPNWTKNHRKIADSAQARKVNPKPGKGGKLGFPIPIVEGGAPANSKDGPVVGTSQAPVATVVPTLIATPSPIAAATNTTGPATPPPPILNTNLVAVAGAPESSPTHPVPPVKPGHSSVIPTRPLTPPALPVQGQSVATPNVPQTGPVATQPEGTATQADPEKSIKTQQQQPAVQTPSVPVDSAPQPAVQVAAVSAPAPVKPVAPKDDKPGTTVDAKSTPIRDARAHSAQPRTSAQFNAVVDAATPQSQGDELPTPLPEPAKPITIVTGKGDAAAASLARSLVQGFSADAAKPEVAQTKQDDKPVFNVAALREAPTPVPAKTTTDVKPVPITQTLTSGANAADQIGQAARLLSASSNASGRHQVTMQLDPPDMGRLRLEVSMQDHTMTLRVDADNAEVARLIQSRMPELKDALSAHGIQVDRTEIAVRSSPSADNGARDNSQSNRSFSDNAGNAFSHGSNDWQGGRPSSQQSQGDQNGWAPDTISNASDRALHDVSAPVSANIITNTELNLVA